MADLIAYTDLASYLNVTFSASEQTTASLCCAAASDAIRTVTNRTFAAQDGSATTRYFTPYKAGDTRAFSSFPWNPGAWGFLPYFFYPVPSVPDRIVPIDDLFLTNQVFADVVAKDHSTAAVLPIDRFWPFNAGVQGLPYTAALFAPGTIIPDGDGAIDILAKWEWPAIPNTVKNAALLQASRLFKRKDAPFGIAGDVSMGSGMRILPYLDPDVAVMVQSARRWWSVA